MCVPTNSMNGNELTVTDQVAKPWILIAEDDHDMLWLLIKVLHGDGFDVTEAGSGLELFDALRQARSDDNLPSLLVSDIRLPGLTGLQMMQKIRDWGLSIPVILITAFPDDETLVEADRLGAVTVLAKPFEMDDLRTAVRYLIERPERAKSLGK